MNTPRILFHLVRADFLERVRRYSFLVMLGLVVLLGYLVTSGKMRMRMVPDYLGVVNSALAGGTMTIMVTFFLGWIGFYIIKGSVSRDYTTGVGQIMATTPISRPLYMFGKWLSNFAVLGICILIMLGEGIVMSLLADAKGFDLVALAAPIVIIGLPGMALVAAFAVLFESIPWLRGGLGNIVYFFFYLMLLFPISADLNHTGLRGAVTNPYIDFIGFQIIGNSVARAAMKIYPALSQGFAFSYTPLSNPKYFTWDGVEWTTDIYLSRLIFLAISVGTVLLASLFFDRFNPIRLLPVWKKNPTSKTASFTAVSETTPDLKPATPVPAKLTPLTGSSNRFRFGALFLAELRLFIKGQRWWWYLVALGLVVVALFSSVETAGYLLIASWLWPVLIMSGLGNRESRFDTRQIIYSSPRPIANQLPAAWLSGFVVLALLGSGALVKFIMAGELHSILGWLTGALFVPSLALALGTFTSSGKPFEAMYVAWSYVLTQKPAPLDFLGLGDKAPLLTYAILSVGLFALALFIRQRQLEQR